MESEEILTDTSHMHPIFTKDPEEWMKLVNKLVKVTTEDGHQHLGFVYTVDPVSESVVLVSYKGDVTDISDIPNSSQTMAVKLLMGASVTDVTVISDAPDNVKQNFECLFRPAREDNISEEELKGRKLRLKSWLEKHRLPVTMGGPGEECLTVANALTIQPPYTEESCLSTNEIILSRIQGLIKNMPVDHETW